MMILEIWLPGNLGAAVLVARALKWLSGSGLVANITPTSALECGKLKKTLRSLTRGAFRS